ncbi:MAG: hypothetical protein FWF31_05390 [Desulfobulbus sp.]|nr:hypothetical protein [Desulfobulbus sp.]
MAAKGAHGTAPKLVAVDEPSEIESWTAEPDQGFRSGLSASKHPHGPAQIDRTAGNPTGKMLHRAPLKEDEKIERVKKMISDPQTFLHPKLPLPQKN